MVTLLSACFLVPLLRLSFGAPMLWLVLRGLGYGSVEAGGSVSGDDDTTDYPTRHRGPPNPLDPIHVAGNLAPARISGLIPRWKAGQTILSRLWQPDSMRDLLVPSGEARKVVFTHPRYSAHLEQLAAFGVLRACALEQVDRFGSYFSVPKTEEVDRSIFDGSHLSDLFIHPPPVSIPDISTVCHMIGEFALEQPTFYGFTVDIRHCFHQLPVHEGLGKKFGVHCAGKTYHFRVLPMGWCHSPAIAQSSGWALLSGRFPNQQAYFDEDFMDDSELPTFIRTTPAAGFAILYYDNFFVITVCADLCERIFVRFRTNIEQCGSAPFSEVTKDLTRFSHKTLRSNPVNFLGCEFACRPRRTRDHAGCEVTWRICPSKIPLEPTWTAEGSCRDIARRTGKILRSLLLSLKPLGASELGRELLVMLSELGMQASTSGWDSSWSATDQHHRILAAGLQRLQENQWFSYEPSPTPNVILMSDASSIMCGWFIAQVSPPKLLAVRTSLPHPGLAKLDIFRREAFAALSGILHVQRLTSEAFTVVVDNTAVAGVLRRLFSFCPLVNKWLQACSPWIASPEVLTVVSADNHADGLSRGEQTVVDIPAVLRLIQATREGRRTGTRTPHRFSSGIRHDDEFATYHAEQQSHGPAPTDEVPLDDSQ